VWELGGRLIVDDAREDDKREMFDYEGVKECDHYEMEARIEFENHKYELMIIVVHRYIL